jgi:hypothetical protein
LWNIKETEEDENGAGPSQVSLHDISRYLAEHRFIATKASQHIPWKDGVQVRQAYFLNLFIDSSAVPLTTTVLNLSSPLHLPLCKFGMKTSAHLT